MKTLIALVFMATTILTAGEHYLADHNFKHHSPSWVSFDSWGGQTSFIKENNRQYMKLGVRPNSGKNFAKAVTYCHTHTFYAGNQLDLKIRLKGQGTFRAGMLTYPVEGGPSQPLSGPVIKLNEQFQDYQVRLTIPSRCSYAYPYIELTSPGTAILDYFQLKEFFQPGVEIKSLNSMQIVSNLADLKTLKFQTSLKNQPLTLCQRHDQKLVEQVLPTSATGELTFHPAALKSDVTEFAVSGQSKHAVTYVSLETPEMYQKSAALARQIKIPRPFNILIIGDSLSDFFRGYNYIDRLSFWLNKYNGNQIYLKNAGVGGDYITRVHTRLQGMTNPKISTWRQYMYNQLFDRKFDLILIFLGQNDTRSWRKENFQKPLVSPDEQNAMFNATFKLIRQYSAAQIVLLSPSPSYAPFFLERAKTIPLSQNVVMFGQPNLVNKFDAVNRKICQEHQLDYIDILTPMRQVKDLKSLYREDGVHLSAAGGRLIADQILQYFAEKFKCSK